MLSKYKSPSSKSSSKKSWLRRRWRYLYRRFLRLRGTPSAIARGLAAGVFTGCFPLLGLQTIFGVIIATVVKGNRIAAVAGTWVSNPLTYVPIFAFNFQVGRNILGGEKLAGLDIEWQSAAELTELGYFVVITLLVGSFCVGLVSSIVAYLLSLGIIRRLRNSKRTWPYYRKNRSDRQSTS